MGTFALITVWLCARAIGQTPPAPQGSGALPPTGEVPLVSKLLDEAQDYCDVGRYALAGKCFEQALALDPHNNTALAGETLIREALARASKRDANRPGYPGRGQLMYPLNVWVPKLQRYGPLNIEPHQTVSPLHRKLQSIIIPEASFRQVKLSAALDYLRNESRRVDPDPDPNERGVDISSQLPAALADDDPFHTGVPLYLPEAADPLVKVTLVGMPLSEALNFLARESGMKVEVGQTQVRLVWERPEMITAEFHDVLETMAKQLPYAFDFTVPEGTSGSSAELVLRSKNSALPPGSSATYFPAARKLLLRSTQENIDLAEALLHSLQEQKTVPPKTP